MGDSTVIKQQAIDSQSTESVFVRLSVFDFLYLEMRTGLTSIILLHGILKAKPLL